MTDNIREKLVELMGEHNSHYVVFCDDCFKDTPEEFNSRMYGLADHLLANNVTVQEHQQWIPEYPTGSNLGRCPVCRKLGDLDWIACPSCATLLQPPKGE